MRTPEQGPAPRRAAVCLHQATSSSSCQQQTPTRTELALTTGFARSTVASRIDALMGSGLVGPAGEAGSSGGGPHRAFSTPPPGVLAVDIRAAHAMIAVTDLNGKMPRRAGWRRIAARPVVVLDRVIEEGLRLFGEAGRGTADLAGAGIGLPGPWNTPPACRSSRR